MSEESKTTEGEAVDALQIACGVDCYDLKTGKEFCRVVRSAAETMAGEGSQVKIRLSYWGQLAAEQTGHHTPAGWKWETNRK